ncbi:MAG: Glycosyltransferase involved in cell wall bisynthesis [Thermodesulfobacterium sp.]|uniref:Glycosyltransferase involved in cell wall bisynthesis n=1 Tax=Candidatus Thermodesulfobacterium syntrophicum TaxID=3060442 RepID=A0AAE3TDW5_9BACT|nr:Glycosyltransferase involved in cell wall bisynthesis [Candidatus Thermodesulfobacterium syntrophicum]
MKVLQLGKFYPPDVGGIESAIYEITEELNRKGVKCDVLCSNSKREYKEEVIKRETYHYKVIRTKSYGKILSTSITPQMIFKLREIINEYDIIHLHHPDPMANLALFLSKPKRKRIIVHWHSDIIRQRFSLKFYKPLLIWMLKHADVIIATSPKYIEESEQLSAFREKCVAIPRGIRKGNLYSNPKAVSNLREKYKGKKIIFSIGRFIAYKGFEYLIESAKYLPSDYIILIGGNGPLRSKYEKIIQKYDLFNKVKLLGRLPQNMLANYYDACDVFCLPSISKNEAFGLVMVEAMSFGKPVVATNIKGSGVSWVNQDGITGLNVEPKNPKALAQAIEFICNNREVYKKFSENALKRFNEEFTIDKEVSRILEIYKSLSKEVVP